MTSVSDRLFVATRKGLFTVVRKSRRWTIDRLEFAGMPVSAVLEDPRDGWRYVALAHGHFGAKLHRAAPGEPFEDPLGCALQAACIAVDHPAVRNSRSFRPRGAGEVRAGESAAGRSALVRFAWSS